MLLMFCTGCPGGAQGGAPVVLGIKQELAAYKRSTLTPMFSALTCDAQFFESKGLSLPALGSRPCNTPAFQAKGPWGLVLGPPGARGMGFRPLSPTGPPLQVECKVVMVFFHYCVVSNYFWLFIEGLYLFTLLVETFFPERTYFYWYTLIGWGRSPLGWARPGLSARSLLQE